MLPIIAAAESARDEGDTAAFDEVALRLVGAVYGTLAGSKPGGRGPNRDERRISAALRRIEVQADETLSLSELARAVAMSPYHFLRTFRAVVGMSPHKFILHTRLRRAAVRLSRTSDDISSIAFAAVWRPVDVQSPLSAHHGRGPKRLPRPSSGRQGDSHRD